MSNQWKRSLQSYTFFKKNSFNRISGVHGYCHNFVVFDFRCSLFPRTHFGKKIVGSYKFTYAYHIVKTVVFSVRIFIGLFYCKIKRTYLSISNCSFVQKEQYLNADLILYIIIFGVIWHNICCKWKQNTTNTKAVIPTFRETSIKYLLLSEWYWQDAQSKLQPFKAWRVLSNQKIKLIQEKLPIENI